VPLGVGGEPGPGSATPRRIIPQSAAPQVDLPGRITTFVQVVRSNGDPVDTMTDSDFRIYENGQPVSTTESGQRALRDPQSFRSFSHLLIDRSNSVQNAQPLVQQGARLYVDTVLAANENAFIKLSWFDGSVDIHSIEGHEFLGFSDDPVALHAAIDDLFLYPPFNGSTNLYGAVLNGLDDLDEEDLRAEALGVENRTLTVVTFTDGTHQAGSSITLAQVTARLATQVNGRPRYNAFSIGLAGEIDPNVIQAIGPQGSVIGDLGSTPGGTTIAEAFERSGQQVRRLANSFYVVSYCSPKSSGTHDLRISAESAINSGDLELTFDAEGFGAGCAFLDIYPHPVLSAIAPGIASPFMRFSDVLEDGQGNVLAVGWHGSECLDPGCNTATDALLVRFTADPAVLDPLLARRDGRIDASFGAQGLADFGSAAPNTGASSIIRMSDGSLVVGGWRRASGLGSVAIATLWHFNAQGQNPVEHTLPGVGVAEQFVTDLVLAGSRVFACGTRTNGSSVSTSVVWSLGLDLVPMLSFGVDGVIVYPENSNTNRPFARALAYSDAGSGRLYVVGDGDPQIVPGSNNGRDLQVFAIEPATGNLDTSFSVDGVAHSMQTFGVSWPGRPRAARIGPLGTLVVGGTIVAPFGSTPVLQPAAWRFRVDGQADNSFRGSASSVFPNTGVVTLRTPSTSNPLVDFGRDSSMNAMTLTPTGKVLLAGQRANTQGHEDMAMVAFGPDGGATNYNTVGFVIDDGAVADDSHDRAHLVLVHSSGTIWTLGHSKDRRDPNELNDDGPDVPVLWIDRDPARRLTIAGQ